MAEYFIRKSISAFELDRMDGEDRAKILKFMEQDAAHAFAEQIKSKMKHRAWPEYNEPDDERSGIKAITHEWMLELA